MMRLGLFLVVALAFAPSLARADDVMPRFDVAAHCKEVASFGGTYSAMMEQQCMKMEQGDYDSLKQRWPGLPESMKDHCLQVASFGGTASYMMLNQCVKMELEAGSADKTFKY